MHFPSIFQRYDTEFTDKLYQDQNWIQSSLPTGPSTCVLDLACGTGRSSVQLLQKGSQVTGVDNNPEALKIYESKAKHLGVSTNLRLLEQDINSQFPAGCWDTILFIGNSIGILESQRKLEEFFNWSAEHLNSNGTLLITMTCMEYAPMSPGVDQPAKKFNFENQLDYERSFSFERTEEFTTFSFKYWQGGQFLHQDILKLNNFHWTLIKSLAEKYFGDGNVSCKLLFSDSEREERNEPYDVFFRIKKA